MDGFEKVETQKTPHYVKMLIFKVLSNLEKSEISQ
jgi:hypothetical protein